jgi:putative FmdB family regulatory protein
MPTYEYQAADGAPGCAQCRTRFEVRQSMRDAALTTCPACGGPIVRLISACGISTQPSTRSMLSDRNLKAKGFTKLVNEGGGKYRRVT